MERLISDPQAYVADSIVGLQMAHPAMLRVNEDPLYVARARRVDGKVAVVSGGGSGHDPLHAGFVGRGMLDAACPGHVFTSPVPEQIVAATECVDNGAGTLHLVKNYSGDVLNFGLAKSDLAGSGVEVRSVLVDDDVALAGDPVGPPPRGLGATVFAEKLAGAAAEQGADLDHVVEIAERTVARSRSIGVGLSSCTRPGSKTPLFELPDGEMEVGVGIHGEAGRERVPVAPAPEIATIMVSSVSTDLDRSLPVIVLLSGLGGTPVAELDILYGWVARELASGGFDVARCLVGQYITSLDMRGASLTVTTVDEEMLSLWDAPVETAALRWGA